MPATLGDHRGVIKAAVTVVNRAANKGSEGQRQRGGDGGREGWDGCRQGRFNGGIVFPFACCFFLFFGVLHFAEKYIEKSLT